MNKFLILILLLLLPFGFVSLYFSTQWFILWPASFLVLLIGLGFWLCAEEKKQLLNVLLRGVLLVVYFLTLFVFLFEMVLIDFSGRGFTDEVFFHMEWESVRIGLNDYFWLLLSFFVLLFFYVYLIRKIYKKLPTLNQRLIITVLAIGLTLLILPLTGYARLYNSTLDFLRIDASNLDEQRIKQYVELGVMKNDRITPRMNLHAETQVGSKNLILIYLESFNEGLTQHPKFPDLTPNLNQLSEQFQSFKHLSSSYVTIEGIISSQCGTLLPMTAGNNTFLRSGQLLSRMPCLGDVLKKAGYNQYYLGGAAMEFAGKGQFFEDHGYDYVWGWEYWREQGMKQRAGVWGLSDTELFEQAIKVIETADKAKPYNLTLLTLGTHLPGYPYAECLPYKESNDNFIHAIHCTDQLLGQFFEKLNDKNLLENTLVVIVADHGVFPTPEMKSLFGDMVEDRTLIGLTNFTESLPDEVLSSYDLAPTILDMLDVRHNAGFLYGQSLFSDAKANQKYATRYSDWDIEKKTMIANKAGECTVAAKQLSWPLNSCDKKSLLAQTNKLLEFYSDKAPEEVLGCEVDIELKSKSQSSDNSNQLLIDDINHFKHFYYEGYSLNYFNLGNGFFVFELNADMKIMEHRYYKDTLLGTQQFLKWRHSNPNHLLVVVKTSNKEILKKLAINLDYEDMDIQVLQYIGNSLKSHHALNLDDSASLTTCF
ncbi:LTA synthase family protein [Marinicella pacifica]|nr:LTA synthase family protein [Marinicella pacifica]